MTVPFISICIPTYKRVDGLKILLDSIKIQTFKNFEILINDNSPDDSIKNLVAEYENTLIISYHKNKPEITAAANAIRVVRRAKAVWVKVMHDDDWFATNDALEQFVKAAQTKGKDFIFCSNYKITLETNRVELEGLTVENSEMLKESLLLLINQNVIGHPSVVMHKNDKNIEYDEQFKWVIDIDFYLRYLKQHGGYHHINERLINIGYGQLQESTKYMKNRLVEIPEYFSLISKYEPAIALKNRFVFHLIWRMISRYKIKNLNEIRSLGFSGPIPDGTTQIISCQKYIPHVVLKQPKWSVAIMKYYFKKFSS